MKKILFALLTVFISINSYASCYPEIIATVIYVTDGDTVTVKKADNTELKIRLSEIDAPESSHYGSQAQPFGEKSKKILTNLVLNKEVTVTPHAIDGYGRMLATIDFEGINVNKYMVKKGAAWAYTQFVIDKSLFRLQKKAKAALLGLWADSNPIPPWKWRETH